MTISILIPVYKGSRTIRATLESLRHQTDKNFTVIIGNDTKKEDQDELKKVRNIVGEFQKDLTITYFENPTNLGCQGNFQILTEKTTSDIILFLAHDDVAAMDMVEIVKKAFQKHPDIGFLLRPYFWFANDVRKPNRMILPPDPKQDVIIPPAKKIDNKLFHHVFEALGQISGLAARKKWMERRFHPDIFPGHMYPIVEIWKKYPGIYIKDAIVAVGTATSQSKTLSTVYDDSPTVQWLRMFDTLFPKSTYSNQNKWGREHILTNYVGLVQIKNYGSMYALFKEIGVLFLERKQNLWNPMMWIFTFTTIITPRFFLRRLSEWYKDTMIASSLPAIRFRTNMK